MRNSKTTLYSLNDTYIARNPGLARLVGTVVSQPVVESSGDAQWDEYRSMMGENRNALLESFGAARAARDSYRNWLCRKVDESSEEEDISFLLDEIESLEAGDNGFNSWDARPTIDDLEYGIIAEERALAVEGDTFCEGYTHLLEQAELGPELVSVREQRFAQKGTAQAFVDRTRKAFKSGDHSAEVISCSVDKGSELPYVAIVLECDGNWDHRKTLAEVRDRRVENALRKISRCETRQELLAVVRIAKKMSRDMQVLNSGHTHDNAQSHSVHVASDIETRRPILECSVRGRQCGVGFNYVRFATVMNAVNDRAAQLNLGDAQDAHDNGFRRYTINEFETTRTPVDGDMLDVGCKQGEFLSLEIEDGNTPESLWFQQEKSWKPSAPLAPSRMFITPPPVEDVLAWQMGMNVEFVAA